MHRIIALALVGLFVGGCSDGPVAPEGTGTAGLTPSFAHGTGGWDAVVLHQGPGSSGNPSCTDLGYVAGYRVNSPTVGTATHFGLFTVTISQDLLYITEWSSSVPVHAVIVKGGPNANEYRYDPPATSDQGSPGLHSPDHQGTPQISHFDFCVSPALVVTKTAATELDRTWSWQIAKDLDGTPPLEGLGANDVLTLDYTVSLSASSVDSDWAVSGTITIQNPAGFGLAAQIQNVTDVVTGGIAGSVTCPVSFPHTLASGASLECTYDAALPNADTRTNTATAVVTGQSAMLGGSGTADVDFSGAVINQVDACVDVVDVLTINGVEQAPDDLGTVCYDDLDQNGEYEFTYHHSFGPGDGADYALTCDENRVDNEVTFITNDSGTGGFAAAGLGILVACEGNGYAGCTPGYWSSPKGSGNWVGYQNAATFRATFGYGGAATNVDNVTLLQALKLGGGSGTNGARQILARAAVAGLLNAAHPDVGYPMTEQEVKDAVNGVIHGTRAAMIALAAELDELNNLGCSIDAHGNPID